ncbi:MAG: all3515 family Zur-repressed PEP-CTERM protein [Armatimonadota bacterium]|nr:all3515 family Zur-repressed PEP-CTERM protein [Armatimonadota bacterium]MDW8289918.1 all3515 family Zur-repressed PEP-CTERM protein [Armatimonadota bacterium]
MRTVQLWLIALAVILFAPFAQAQYHDVYFVGVDGFSTIASGTYRGLPNPNFGRLTLLFAHYTPGTEHYHPIGAWSYSGPPASPAVNNTNANNRLPELYQRTTGQEYIYLYPGSGAFAGYYRSGIVRDPAREEYSFLLTQPTGVLADSTDPAVQRLYNSSAGRWRGSLGEARVGLRLVDITPGLRITLEDGTPILPSVGSVYEIGRGDRFAFTPVFSVAFGSPIQPYTAAFQLIDLNNTPGYRPLRDSGIFYFDFYPVPEPSTMAVLGAGLLGLWLHRRRR